MTRPVCEITGRYLAKESPSRRDQLRGLTAQPGGQAEGEPGVNSDWAQLARIVITQEMAFKGGVK